MMTIVTDIHLKQGAENRWDSTMRTRMAAAEHHPGWVAGQLLSPADEPLKRVIVGTWNTREDWSHWHDDPLFAETRQTLDSLASEPPRHTWHEVVLDVRKTDGARGGRNG
jgi:heme-degrading monooxygenase HmoA